MYEQALFYDRAAKAYELVLKLSGNNKSSLHVADALYNAGLLRQALGQNDKAIAHYKEYAKQFSSRKDAPDVAFNIGPSTKTRARKVRRSRRSATTRAPTRRRTNG